MKGTPRDMAARQSRPAPLDWSTSWTTAARLAQTTALGLAQEWRRSARAAVERYTLTTLGTAFGLGVISGWLVKRR